MIKNFFCAKILISSFNETDAPQLFNDVYKEVHKKNCTALRISSFNETDAPQLFNDVYKEVHKKNCTALRISSFNETDAPQLFNDVYRLVHEEKRCKQMPVKRAYLLFDVWKSIH